MRFQILTNILISLLEKRGWVITNDGAEKPLKFVRAGIFNEPVQILYPQDTNSADFPFLLSLSLKILLGLEPALSKHYCLSELIALSKNIKHKFSKQKKDWILREPKVKYENNEIPDIYIPIK
ncbi:hypothetical protein DF947_01600 [Pedobacter paludis]|uniref:Uncharacterized protein n=1 Tax=Pedobacter paludis TaxID=2203212 RepID=A0A317F5M1_9SPHI|nr:hypothetical protein DF947_01600 [Pedobacter paludis]